MFENATEVCRCLSSLFDNLTENEIGVFDEKLVVIMYDRSISTNKVNEAHPDLFAHKQRPYNGIPQSKAAIRLRERTSFKMVNFHKGP